MKAFCLLSAALLVPLGAALAAPSATIEPDAPLRSEARTVVRIGLLDFESEASYLSRRENIQETISAICRKIHPVSGSFRASTRPKHSPKR